MKTVRTIAVRLALLVAVVGASSTLDTSRRAAAAEPAIGPEPQLYEKVVGQAVRYLLNEGQADDGSYSAHVGPGVTSLVVTGLLRSGRSPDDPAITKSLDYLEQFVHKDGGIYRRNASFRNYETCLTMLCLSEANRDGRYDKRLAAAAKFVKGIQWDEEEGHDLSSFSYGGAGYGKHRRPDLSNTSFLVDALKTAGIGPDDPAMKNALAFVSRCQNLETSHNTTPFSAKNPDGGFYYTPAAGGTSQAGKTAAGGLRSYGSMTYAGLKSMLFAGVGPDDPRVKAAVEWIQAHYDLSSNPGMGNAGLYYYYHTFAKALDAIGLDRIEDTDGHRHDWRRELVEELASRQLPSGSWINENPRWLEGDPNLVAGYALLTLSYCRPKAGK